MISKGKSIIGTQDINSEIWLGGDYKYILRMLGPHSASSILCMRMVYI